MLFKLMSLAFSIFVTMCLIALVRSLCMRLKETETLPLQVARKSTGIRFSPCKCTSSCHTLPLDILTHFVFPFLQLSVRS
jgi:hypothetical protein